MRHLFIFRCGPFSGGRSQEALDFLLTVAAFDQAVNVLFVDDGVWRLLPEQKPDVWGYRNPAALWRDLEMYGIGVPWLEEESLMERGLQAECLLLPVRLLARARLRDFLCSHDRILGD